MKRLVPEINVTPLVDVVLVLLIIFMVIAPQLEAGEPVELPAAKNVASKNELDAVTVTLTASGRMLLERDVLEMPELEARLKALHEREPEKKLVLKVDRTAKYGIVRRVFGTAQAIGFRGVALVVDEAKAS